VNAAGVAGRYASALFDLGREQDSLERVGADLVDLKVMLAESPELRRALASPLVPQDAKLGIVRALGEKAGLHDLTVRFLGVLGRQDRLAVIDAVIDTFDTLLADARGEVAVEVVSAMPLSSAQENTVKDMLAGSLGKSINLRSAVDPDLLGGLIVRVGSRMIDASLKTKLRHLELAMRGAG
jgi:F-type H+-transporting ATPase subunit delta